MPQAADELRFILLWWGENALDWEVDLWQRIPQLGTFQAAEGFLEAFSHEEWQEKHDQLITDGWQFTSSGSGGLSRVSVFTRKS